LPLRLSILLPPYYPVLFDLDTDLDIVLDTDLEYDTDHDPDLDLDPDFGIDLSYPNRNCA